uniref:Uncharacterized protein n=1 Tax=Rhizophora mucronata TaxID=61149 RepID=A0A2P2PLW9_RHIMU
MIWRLLISKLMVLESKSHYVTVMDLTYDLVKQCIMLVVN